MNLGTFFMQIPCFWCLAARAIVDLEMKKETIQNIRYSKTSNVMLDAMKISAKMCIATDCIVVC